MDFLAFKTFISPVALIVFYYLGAVLMPIFVWFSSRWIMKKIGFLEKGYQEDKDLIWARVSLENRVLFGLVLVMIFLFMELMWRMMFEFLIAYMQMWEALVT